MGVFINGKNKAKSMFINGKDVNKAYYNGKLVFNKSGWHVSYGKLTWMSSDLLTLNVTEITKKSDYDLLFYPNQWGASQKFSFSDDLTKKDQVRGWEFNTSPKSLIVENLLPSSFMIGMHNLTGNIKLPDVIKKVGYQFCSYTNIQFVDFNKAEEISAEVLECSAGNFTGFKGDNLLKIGTQFLISRSQNCYLRNSFDINLPKVKEIRDDFMYDLYSKSSWNGALNLPLLEKIGNNFLHTHINFNNKVDLPAIKTIGTGFLQECIKFNRPIHLGPNVTSIGDILANTNGLNFASSITIDSNNYTVGSICTYSSEWCDTFEFKENCDYTGTYFMRIAEKGNPHFIFNCPASQIAYRADSFTRKISVAGQAPTAMYYSGKYAEEVIAKFPTHNESGNVIRVWVPYPDA